MNISELLNQASKCAESGDKDGELEAYRQADKLGDALASLLLGVELRRRGEFDLAREALERAEGRGNSEAAMVLGNLLIDTGDRQGAKSAYLRAIEMGNSVASLNLGLELAQEGDTDGALVHLRNAGEAGDPVAFWGIGSIFEQRSDFGTAAEAYRKGVELGDTDDAACALGLGFMLYESGDRDGARKAFELARDSGNSQATQLLQALEIEEQDAPSSHQGLSINEIWYNVIAIVEALVDARSNLGRQWITATLAIQESEAQLKALGGVATRYRNSLNDTCRQFLNVPYAPKKERHSEVSVLPSLPNDWLQVTSGVWKLSDEQTAAFEFDLREAHTQFNLALEKRFGGLKNHRQGIDTLHRIARRLEVLESTIEFARTEIAQSKHARTETALEEARQQAQSVLDPIFARSAESATKLPAILQPWTSPFWDSWSINKESEHSFRLAYAGVLIPMRDPNLGDNADFGTDLRIPFGYELHDNLYLAHDSQSRNTTHGFVRSMMLRHLLSVEPGEVKFCVFDPVGLGQSAGDLLDLAEYDADLIGGKVWSSTKDLDARLAELSSHIELVIQKYLRTTYQNIDEFNDAAGEVAESYRVLVLFDFPTGITTETAARLKSIIENGPRCGVFTILAADLSVGIPYGVDLEQVTKSMRRLNLKGNFVDNINGYRLETTFVPEILPEQSELIKRIIDGVGRANISRIEATVTFQKVFSIYSNVAARGLRPELGKAAIDTEVGDLETWWRDDSTRGIFAPIGQKGARDVAVLGFDSSDHAGALLVGRPGSGKSTLLHTYLGGLTTLYGPDELELYLIDFKEGVEFKAYAEEKLPHAKVIAIESDREFGLSVLESIQAEITKRAELLRATGGKQAGVRGLRETTGDKVSRILLVFDEFQVLFSRNDKVGLAAADLLESIIRQGRGFGVHVLLGSQSLAGLDALGSHVPQLLPVRILLPATESDAHKVLADGNNAGDYLISHGEGILNTAGGVVEANERFKGALLAETDRVSRLKLMRAKANDLGFTREPMVFEGNSLIPLDTQDPYQFKEEMRVSGTNPIRVRTGAPMTVGEIGDLILTRESGSNVLAIVRSGDSDTTVYEQVSGPAYGLLASAVLSVTMTNSSIDVIDFMSNDDGLDVIFEPLIGTKRITLKRRRALSDVLSSFVNEVRERVEEDDAKRPAMLLFLFGIHRARDLNSEVGSLDVDESLVQNLEYVMRDGPEVGVHVWIWSDSVAGASRRMTSAMMREVGWRIAGKMSGDDSQRFIGNYAASELRESQLLIVNDDSGISTRVTAYAPPSRGWITQVIVEKQGE